MLSIIIRTDKPQAEIGLYADSKQLSYITWQAHRELSETLHLKIKELLSQQNKQLADLQGIVIFKGPGSFTGLRIGFSVANALAQSLNLPIVSEMGENWIAKGIERLQAGDNEKISLPEYGSPPNITRPKH